MSGERASSHPERSGRSERAEHVRAIVKQTLWDKPLHPATAFQTDELFNTLMSHASESKGRVVLHKQEGDLHIFHYGQMVQNQATWTAELLLARGLVIRKDRDGCSIVATPWPKFFNLGEDGIALEDLEAAAAGGRVEATSKIDGSLGLVFHHDGMWRVITKGSFGSTQGHWATAWLNKHVDLNALTVGVTYLVEIIYPENRIVIPYTFSTLVLLSAFDADGRELERLELESVAAASRLEEPEPQPEPEQQLDCANATSDSTDGRYGLIGTGRAGLSLPALHSANNLEELMKTVNSWPGSEREGVVLRFVFPSGASHRVKIKGAAYIAMHRNKDGFSKKKVYEAARKGRGILDDMRNTLAEELLSEFDAVVDEVDQACNMALLDVAQQWELAKLTLFTGQRDIVWTKNARKLLSQWTQQQSSWSDGTAISDAFRACMFSTYMPHTKVSATVGIPTQPGAWQQLEHPDRGALLGYVLPLLAGSALGRQQRQRQQQQKQSETTAKVDKQHTISVKPGEELLDFGVAVPSGGHLNLSVAAKAEKKRAKRARQKAKKSETVAARALQVT